MLSALKSIKARTKMEELDLMTGDERKYIALMWKPAHMGIRADRVAKRAAEKGAVEDKLGLSRGEGRA